MQDAQLIDGFIALTKEALETATDKQSKDFFNWQIGAISIVEKMSSKDSAIHFINLSIDSRDPFAGMDNQLAFMKHLEEQAAPS